MGDIDLRNEIRLNNGSGLVRRRRTLNSVRRMYSAKIHGRDSDMTVALYQGNNSEEVGCHLPPGISDLMSA